MRRSVVAVVALAACAGGAGAALLLADEQTRPVVMCADAESVDLDRLRRPPLVYEEELEGSARRYGITLVTLDDGNAHCSVEERDGSFVLTYHRND